MSDSKKHNSILFLTTLSVYLGLVLVGGAGSTALAQVANTIPASKKTEILAGDKIITLNANWAIELEKILAENPAPVYLLGTMALPDKGVSDWKILKSEGSAEAVEFLRKQFLSTPVVSPKDLPLPYEKLSFEAVVNPTEIKIKESFSFRKDLEAREFHFYFENLLENKEKIYGEIGQAEKLYLQNTKTKLENNQVTIVTRLPRASIDSLFAEQDAN